MKKIVVCGDSYMSRDPKFPNTHFSELLSLEYEVVNLAYPGVSNVDICFQIQQAMSIRADYVIIGNTDPARIEIPIYDNTEEIFTPELKHFRNGDSKRFISSTINTFIGEEQTLRDLLDLSPDVRNAVKKYLLHIFDYNLKYTTDKWLMDYWKSQLSLANIPFYHVERSRDIYVKSGNFSPAVYHTTEQTQREFAQLLNDKLNMHFKKDTDENTNTR